MKKEYDEVKKEYSLKKEKSLNKKKLTTKKELFKIVDLLHQEKKTTESYLNKIEKELRSKEVMLLSTINMIGELVIKNKLYSMHSEVFEKESNKKAIEEIKRIANLNNIDIQISTQ